MLSLTSNIPPIQLVSERFPALEEQEIVFSFSAPGATEVHVAGAFNNWSSDATPLADEGLGEWEVHLMLRSGEYEYGFIVDGRWCEDPEATQHIANARGGFNSLLNVPLEVRTFLI